MICVAPIIGNSNSNSSNNDCADVSSEQQLAVVCSGKGSGNNPHSTNHSCGCGSNSSVAKTLPALANIITHTSSSISCKSQQQ